MSEILESSTECLRVPKAGSQISRLPVESSRKRRKSARAPIPCKHLQWICELFKRLNSLKNLVCTGVVCHRLRPPHAALAYIPRGAGGSSLPQTTKTISPPLQPRFTLSPFVFLTIDILRSVKKRTTHPSFCRRARCRPDVEQIIRAENLRKLPRRG